MMMFFAWSGDEAWLYFIGSFIILAVGIYRVVVYYRKISGRSKGSVPENRFDR
jgi:hypothetical protein